MGFTNSRATIKWWNPHTKKLKYFPSEKFDKNNNKFGKGWSPGYELMTGTPVSTFPTLKINISYHPIIKNDIFEVIVTLTPRGTTTGTLVQYCENHNVSYIFKSTNNRPRNSDLTVINRNNVWILSIGRK